MTHFTLSEFRSEGDTQDIGESLDAEIASRRPKEADFGKDRGETEAHSGLQSTVFRSPD